MPDRVLDLRLFRYAMASAQHGSFRRAAAALNVQHSTVSKGIRNLEYLVGAELFERGHAGIRPTPAGDQFLKEAALGFDHMRRALQRAGALQRGEQGELTVGVSVPFVFIGDLFELFRKAYSGVSVEIVESTTSASWGLIQQRKVDVAFVARTRGNGMYRSLHLCEERMIVVLPKTHPLAGARKVKLEDLRHETFILSAGGLGPDIENHLARRMAKWNVEPRIQLHRVGQCDLTNMVARGFGLSVVLGPLSHVPHDDVMFVPLTGRNVVSMCAIWMESNPNPALKALLKILQGLDGGTVR